MTSNEYRTAPPTCGVCAAALVPHDAHYTQSGVLACRSCAAQDQIVVGEKRAFMSLNGGISFTCAACGWHLPSSVVHHEVRGRVVATSYTCARCMVAVTKQGEVPDEYGEAGKKLHLYIYAAMGIIFLIGLLRIFW